ncbi:MAG: RNA polymerase factor sigma-32 [Pseudomonadota bacterium]|nr:RNA polymerase factor sigma-32 [Pseudomonadota bacterium]
MATPSSSRTTSSGSPELSQQRFIKSAMKQDLLSREEELDLARRWKEHRDERAMHRLTEAHMRLVIALAAKYRRYGLPYADLIQEGNIGLMKAVERFDPERDVRFSTYVSWWIRSCIQDYVLRNWSIVRTGTTSAQKSLFFNLRRLKAQIGALDSNTLTPEHKGWIAQQLGVRHQDVEAMADRLAANDRSLNAPVGEDEAGQWQDLLADERATPDEEYMQSHDSAQRSAWLHDAIGTLNDRERYIIEERRLSESGSTLEALGRTLGISKERVRQIESVALNKLRNALTSTVGDPEESGLIPTT